MEYCRTINARWESEDNKDTETVDSGWRQQSWRVRNRRRAGCDKVIIVNENEFHINSTLLATQSSFFENMFRSGMRESNETSITLHLPELSSDGFSDWLDEINSPESVYLTSKNVLEVLKVANFTQSHWVLERCKYTITELLWHCPNSGPMREFGIKVYALGYLFDLSGLQFSTRRFVVANLAEALNDNEFKNAITCEKLLEFLKEKDLNVVSEEKLLLGILSWVNADKPARKRFLGDLLKHVYLNCVPVVVLKDNLYKEELMTNKQCLDLYIDAIHCHAIEEMKATRPRRSRYQRYDKEDDRFLVTFKCEPPMYYEPKEDKWYPLSGLDAPTGRNMKCVGTASTIYLLVDSSELWQFHSLINAWDELDLPMTDYTFDNLVYLNGVLYLTQNKRMWKRLDNLGDTWKECEPCKHNCTKTFSFGKYIIRLGRSNSKKNYYCSCYDVSQMKYFKITNEMGHSVIAKKGNSQSIMIINGGVYNWYKWMKYCIKNDEGMNLESGSNYQIPQVGIPTQFKETSILLNDQLYFVVGHTLFPHNTGNSYRNIMNIKENTIILPGEKSTAFVHLARECFRKTTSCTGRFPVVSPTR